MTANASTTKPSSAPPGSRSCSVRSTRESSPRSQNGCKPARRGERSSVPSPIPRSFARWSPSMKFTPEGELDGQQSVLPVRRTVTGSGRRPRQNRQYYAVGAGSAFACFMCMNPRRNPMKRLLRAVAVLLVALVAIPLFAASRNLVDDVIRMYRSGVPEEAIVQFVQKTDGRFDVTADDLIAMADAKMPRTIIKAVLDESDIRSGREGVRDTRAASTTVVVELPYYNSWYDPWYYDPFWYG